MRSTRKLLAVLALILLSLPGFAWAASEPDPLPPQLSKEQRDHLLRFLADHSKPERFIPADAKLVGSKPADVESSTEKPAQPIKQYMVQITPHRPVADAEKVTKVDVYYYRPNPEKGKPGITVRHTVDVTTGKQVGETEVLFNRHTPLSREELNEALALAREKSAPVQKLYQDYKQVRYEYLQLMISRKHGPHQPGDRVVRFVFTATPAEGQAAPTPVRVIVNLTQGVAAVDER